MKKKRLLLMLIFPFIGGAFYLRALSSWRPKVVFKGATEVGKLLFSSDGKTLLVGQNETNFGPARLTSLYAAHGFRLNWTYPDKGYSWQFFANDTRILARNVGSVSQQYTQTLEAQTGKKLSQGPLLLRAAISADGQWIAHQSELRQETAPGSNSALFQQDVFVDPTVNALRHSQGASQTKQIADRTIITQKQTMACSFAFSPDSKTLAVGQANQITGESYIDFYDVPTWKNTRRWSDFKSSTLVQTQEEAVQWSRDGKLLLSYSAHAFVSPSPSNTIVTFSLWRTSDGKRLVRRTMNGDNGGFPLGAFQLQNNGSVLAMCEGKGIVLDEIATLSPHSRLLFPLASQTIAGFTLSPDGTYLLVGTAIGRVYWQRVI